MRIGGLAAILTLAAFVSGYALAQEGYGTVTFTVEVAGSHHVPTGEFDGFRYTKKKRVFRGTARLKYAGQSFAAPSPAGYDKAAFEREKDACEQKFSDEEKIAACQDEVQARQNAAQRAAMQRVNPAAAAMSATPIDVWASESCSGELEVADTGTYRRFDKDERRISEVPTSLTAKRLVTPDAQGSDGCAFNLTYDPTAKTALINIDPGPLRVEAIEKTNQSIARTHINPFDWSAIRKFEKGDISLAEREPPTQACGQSRAASPWRSQAPNARKTRS
jgi:hypothetical protein